MQNKTLKDLGINHLYTQTIKTKRYEGDDAVETELTLDYSNCHITDLIVKAIKSDTISWQAGYRNKKENITIPDKSTYVVPRPGMRTVTQATPEALVARFGSVEEAIKQLEALRKG